MAAVLTAARNEVQAILHLVGMHMHTTPERRVTGGCSNSTVQPTGLSSRSTRCAVASQLWAFANTTRASHSPLQAGAGADAEPPDWEERALAEQRRSLGQAASLELKPAADEAQPTTHCGANSLRVRRQPARASTTRLDPFEHTHVVGQLVCPSPTWPYLSLCRINYARSRRSCHWHTLCVVCRSFWPVTAGSSGLYIGETLRISTTFSLYTEAQVLASSYACCETDIGKYSNVHHPGFHSLSIANKPSNPYHSNVAPHIREPHSDCVRPLRRQRLCILHP